MLSYDPDTGQLRTVLNAKAPAVASSGEAPKIYSTQSNLPPATPSDSTAIPGQLPRLHVSEPPNRSQPTPDPGEKPPNPSQPHPPPSSSDPGERNLLQTIAVAGLWGAGFATVLGAGLFGFMEGHIPFGWLYTVVGLLGLAAMTLHLFDKLREPTPAVTCAFLALTWVMLGTDLWNYFSKPPEAGTPPSGSAAQPDARDATIRDLQRQVGELKTQLETTRRGGAAPSGTASQTSSASKPSLPREERNALETQLDIYQGLDTNYMVAFVNAYNTWSTLKVSWWHDIQTDRPKWLGQLGSLRKNLLEASQKLESLRQGYPEFSELSDLLMQRHTGAVIAAIDRLTAVVQSPPSQLPVDYEIQVRPYAGALTSDFEVLRTWFDRVRESAAKRAGQIAQELQP